MDTRTLDGLAVSRICLGTMTFGAQADEAAAASMLDLALERGVTFVDTANVYNGGATEALLGRILRGRRDRVVLASKVGIPMGEAPDERGLSPAAIRRGVEDSLRRLGTDRLDLYYLHQPDPATPLEASLEALDGLVRAGLVRAVGTSNYASWQVARMRGIAERDGLRPVGFTQSMYNLLARGVEPEFLPMARALGCPVVAYNPLAGGLLTGKHAGATSPSAGSRFDRMPAYRDRYWNEANHAAVRELRGVADAEGRSLVALALSWLLHHTPTDCVVVGASRLEQLAENLDVASSAPLSADGVAACDVVWRALRGPAPQYNR